MVEKNNRTARKWGYARVSTEDQDLGLQMAALRNAGIAIILVFAELERNMISERTKAGLAKRRAEGATPGRTHTIRTFPKRLAKFAELRDSGQLETMTHQAVVDAMNKADPRKPKIGHVETYRKWRRDGFPDAPDLPDEPLDSNE